MSVVRNLLVSEIRKLNEIRILKMTLFFIFFWFLSTCRLSLKFFGIEFYTVKVVFDDIGPKIWHNIHTDCIRLRVPLEKGTFQDTTAALFNNLPNELKICADLNLFTSRLFKFLKNRAKARL